MLTAIYGTLGAIATVAAVFLGFGWYSSARVLEREKTALERELRALVTAEVRKVENAAVASLAARATSLERAMDERATRATERLDLGLQQGLTQLESKLKGTIASVSASVSTLEDEVLRLRVQAELADRAQAVQTQVLGNALASSVRALEHALKLADDYVTADVLDGLKQDIEALLSKSGGAGVDHFAYSELIAVLDRVRGTHGQAAANLKARAAALMR
jgi:hypothetical protein